MAVLLLGIFSLPMLLIALLVKFTSKGHVLYWSDRVGKNNSIFKMAKFRTMRIDTPAVATHLLSNPDEYLTPIGSFLWKLSLDELPQLWTVLKGDMSLVWPRPALYNQEDLVALRTEKGVHKLIPGVTHWKNLHSTLLKYRYRYQGLRCAFWVPTNLRNAVDSEFFIW